MRLNGYLCLVACIGAVLFAGCSRRGSGADDSGSAPVSFTTRDGYEIAADVFRAPGARPPGLLLVHMLGSDRHAWDYFAGEARAQGYTSVSFDLRGHGESRHPELDGSYEGFTTDDWLGALQDVAAAKSALLDAGADPNNLAVVGASMGANLALRYAAADPDIQAVVLLSPGLDYEGVTTAETLADFEMRPVLLMAADRDPYAAFSCAKLEETAPGYSELRVYPGSAHGTDLLDTSDSAVAQIMSWLEPIVGAADGTR